MFFMKIFMLVLVSACAVPSVQLDQYVEISQKTFDNRDLNLATQIEKYKVEKKFYDDVKKFYDDAAMTAHIKKTALKEKISEAAVRSRVLKTKAATDLEVKKYYEKNREKIPYSFEFSKSELQTQVTDELEKNSQKELISSLEKTGFYNFDVDVPQPPKIEVNPAFFPTIGTAKNPKLTIVEIFDYLCPFCKMEEPKLQRLLKKFPDKILLVVIDYAQIHGDLSRKLALGGWCAKKVSRYREYREIFTGYMQKEENFYNEGAKVLQMPVDSFKSCVAHSETRRNLDASEALVQNWGLSQTPVFFLNGEFIGSQLNEETIENVILKN